MPCPPILMSWLTLHAPPGSSDLLKTSIDDGRWGVLVGDVPAPRCRGTRGQSCGKAKKVTQAVPVTVLRLRVSLSATALRHRRSVCLSCLILCTAFPPGSGPVAAFQSCAPLKLAFSEALPSFLNSSPWLSDAPFIRREQHRPFLLDHG